MRKCHSVRSHPETRLPGKISDGAMHQWQKQQVSKFMRRYAKSLIRREVMTYVTENEFSPDFC